MTGKRERLDAALSAAVAQWCEEEFVWGRADCLLSLADVVLAACGYDPAAPFRGRYSTARGALRVTREFGGFEGALNEMATRCRWRRLLSPREALVGDVGVLVGGARSACGVMRYRTNWVGRTETGFAAVPDNRVLLSWRVR